MSEGHEWPGASTRPAGGRAGQGLVCLSRLDPDLVPGAPAVASQLAGFCGRFRDDELRSTSRPQGF